MGLRHPVFVGDTPGTGAARACGRAFLYVDTASESAGRRSPLLPFGHLTEWLLGQSPRTP